MVEPAEERNKRDLPIIWQEVVHKIRDPWERGGGGLTSCVMSHIVGLRRGETTELYHITGGSARGKSVRKNMADFRLK